MKMRQKALNAIDTKSLKVNKVAALARALDGRGEEEILEILKKAINPLLPKGKTIAIVEPGTSPYFPKFLPCD